MQKASCMKPAALRDPKKYIITYRANYIMLLTAVGACDDLSEVISWSQVKKVTQNKHTGMEES